jgi:hypothetical protein
MDSGGGIPAYVMRNYIPFSEFPGNRTADAA